jgi:sarcosine oxidase subunit gamma
VTLSAYSAIAPLPQTAVGTGVPQLVITERKNLAIATVIARKGQGAALRAAFGQRFGVLLPDRPTCAAAGGITVIGMAPQQWLAVAEEDAAVEFLDHLTIALGLYAAITEQSDARAVLRLQGSKARAALAKGLPIDLHPHHFKPGDAALTVMALTGVHLWQIDDNPTYDLAVSRSMASGLVSLLIDNAAEYGVEFRPNRDTSL